MAKGSDVIGLEFRVSMCMICPLNLNPKPQNPKPYLLRGSFALGSRAMHIATERSSCKETRQ